MEIIGAEYRLTVKFTGKARRRRRRMGLQEWDRCGDNNALSVAQQ